MTNTKSTKRALLVSVMAMVICFTMLLGTTFAWFTDTKKVENNVIEAGTLKVQIDATPVNIAKAEPGYVHVQPVKITNIGTLAFNYKLSLNEAIAPTTSKDLAEVIDVYYVLGTVSVSDRTAVNDIINSATPIGTLASLADGGTFFGAETALEGEFDNITLIYVVPTDVNNDYQGASAGTFTITVRAAQLAAEEDSINDQYDADSKYDNGDAGHP